MLMSVYTHIYIYNVQTHIYIVIHAVMTNVKVHQWKPSISFFCIQLGHLHPIEVVLARMLQLHQHRVQ